MSIIKLNKLHVDAVIPEMQYHGDAAFDVVATSMNLTENYIEYGLGFSSEIPEGLKGVIVPRSSISNKSLIMCNSPAQIDSGYRGEWKVRFKVLDLSGTADNSKVYSIGDRIAQVYFEEVNNVFISMIDSNGNTTQKIPRERERLEGGFGSSGV